MEKYPPLRCPPGSEPSTFLADLEKSTQSFFNQQRASLSLTSQYELEGAMKNKNLQGHQGHSRLGQAIGIISGPGVGQLPSLGMGPDTTLIYDEFLQQHRRPVSKLDIEEKRRREAKSKMEFDIEDFVAQPGLDKYNQCRKEDLFLIAAHFKVPVSKQDRKEAVKKQLHDALVDKNILPPISTLSHGATLPSPDHGLRKLELELEMRRLELKDRELQREFEFRKLELEENTRRESLRLSARSSRSNDETGLDVNKCVRMVPPFCEKDVDKYFVLFERVAVTLDWPKDIWPLLLQ